MLLLLLPLPLQAQQTLWEFSLGAEYLLTAYSFRSNHNAVGTGIEAAWYYCEESGTAHGRAPEAGVKFDFGYTPQGICGNRFGVAAMLRTPLCPWLDADMGLGLSSYSKPNYRTGNAENVYISTPLVCLVDFGLVAPLGDRSHVALRVLHSSNGNMRRPNRGLNYFRLELGMALPPREVVRSASAPAFSLRPPASFQGPWHEVGFTLIPSCTFSHHNMQQGLFFCYDVALNYAYRATPAVAYGATVDLWYNFSHPWQLPRYHDNYTFPMYVSALLFFERFWGPISLKGGIGGVIAASSRVMVPVYERLAVYYNFGRHYAGIGINAHIGQAEYIEWSYGYRIPVGKK